MQRKFAAFPHSFRTCPDLLKIHIFMDLVDYQKHIAALPFGKRRPAAL